MMRPTSTLIKVATNDLLQQRSKELLDFLDKQQLLDVTFLTETEDISAHKLILSTASPVLRNIFERTSERHPIIVMKGSQSQHIRALLDFIYKGETLVDDKDLHDFINLVNDLKIEGLAESLETHFKAEAKVTIVGKDKEHKDMKEVQKSHRESISNDANDTSVFQMGEGELKNVDFQQQYPNKRKEHEDDGQKANTEEYKRKRRKYKQRGGIEKSKEVLVVEDLTLKILTPKKRGRPKKSEARVVEDLTLKKLTPKKRGRPKKSEARVVEDLTLKRLTPKKFGSTNKTENLEIEFEVDEDLLELGTSSSEIMSDFGLMDYGDDEMNVAEKKSWEAQARAYIRSTPKYKHLREKLLTMVIKYSSHNYGCTECDSRMPSRSKAIEHVGQHENKLDEEHKFVCDCGKSYSKMTSIRFHYPCPEALKKFIQSVQSVANKYSASTSEIAEALSSTTDMDEDE